MLSGPLALLSRSLRLDARSKSIHFLRFALLVFVYFNFCVVWFFSHWYSAPGQYLFSSISYLNALFVSLLGLGYFASAITEEKEEDTLGLMLMAGISPVGILAGKFGARYLQAISLLIIQVPLMMLCVTLGGIMYDQIWAATVSLIAYLSLISGLGLFCSTIARNSRTASALVVLGLVLYFLAGPYLMAALGVVVFNSLNPWDMEGFSVFLRLFQILQSGFAGSVWSPQVVLDFGLGTLFAGLSWLCFGYATRNPTTEAIPRELVARRRRFFRFSAGRVHKNPFAWKDFHFASGGYGGLTLRIVFYLMVGVSLAFMFVDDATGFSFNEDFVANYITVIYGLLPLDLAISFSRSMNEEIRQKTLPSLVMLPVSVRTIVYSKLAGAAAGSLPGLCILAGLLLLTYAGQEMIVGFLSNSFMIFGLLGTTLFLLLIPNYAATLALDLRWGSVPAAIGLAILTYIALSTATIFGYFIHFFLPGGTFLLFDLLLIVAHVLSHRRLFKRFRELAET